MRGCEPCQGRKAAAISIVSCVPWDFLPRAFYTVSDQGAGEIRRFLRDNGSLKVSRSIREQAVSLYRAREQLRQENGEEPTLSALAEYTGITVEEIARIDLACDEPESLQAELGDGLTLEGTLGGDAPEERMVERLALEEAIGKLPERERLTIQLRYFHGMTQERTARVLGVSQVQVSRLEKRGLERLRQLLRP